jgi:hypothetical protein
MDKRFIPLRFIIITLLAVMTWAPNVQAGGGVRPEVWLGGGVSWPDYHGTAEVCVRGGIGAVFLDHFTLGISGQADRDHFHYFADGGVILPEVWLLVPYGRYQFGRRADRDDNATGWCAGMRLEGEGVSMFVEFHQIVEPDDNKGISLGMWF